MSARAVNGLPPVRRRPPAAPASGPPGVPAPRDPGARAAPPRAGATLLAVEILGLGVDICEIARMERALARHPTMRGRVFTPEEIAYCDSKARPAESYAGRFAAREAVIKALGGYRGKSWQDISVTRAPTGAPAILLEGNAKRRADMLGVTRVLVTFTHERTNAVAFAVAVGP
jgi:phosphopantetheine--protein transferase-like protein